MELRCYNCGCLLSKNTKTDEHIPMQALYCGYPKQELLTPIEKVPACSSCNNQYSKIEEDFKNIIALWAINEKINISDEFIQSCSRSPKLRSKIQLLHGEFIAIFSSKNYNDVHIKNFKGLYYKQYGEPLPLTYQIGILADLSDKIDYPNLHPIFSRLMKESFDFENSPFSGNKDVFQYKIKDVGIGYICTMVYFKKLFARVYAIRK
ncbi:hypothetical protein GAC87_00145 [Bacteroides thetaiotaomicron]|jgi:hypothetical protein|uniref:hypothetical protein n=3 Tax=Bacteroides TaxID=816 RepID=UPI001306BFD2|nr:hypothetical protein [Bacteroides thetaiotaomicron]KAB4493616.1 hypothetical protein GAN71_02840 [Bacteroides thetaiotaomicron]KAB4501434.1 hypothetical protein GAN60_00715 [Bacteroides thetaiotaomicron]KAB4504010.1 hypothetical protein GAN85_00955 [Bacteroides thetaiotaomicron]KAB4513625.1 hypothetical protein GAN72_02225 [Bacteroides thetaiotaomicron]KAB4517866.1 hypothetical protein GAN78_02215 [Bacteroides thetaiotaomicron]